MNELWSSIRMGLKETFSDPSFLQILTTAVALFIASLFKRVRTTVGNMLHRFVHGKQHHLNSTYTKQYDTIGNDLLALRIVTDADRVAVFQFHNGDEFTLSNPIFKVTCSHERVKNGLTFTSDIIKFSLVTNFMDFIGPLMDSSRETPGVTEMPYCLKTADNTACRITGSPLRILRYSVDDMPYSMFKYIMETQGVATLYATLLFSKERMRPLGILCLQYQDEEDPDDFINENICTICDTTMRIQFLLDAAK